MKDFNIKYHQGAQSERLQASLDDNTFTFCKAHNVHLFLDQHNFLLINSKGNRNVSTTINHIRTLMSQ